MILATLDSATRYAHLLPDLDAALRWLRETDLESLTPGGSVEIDGQRLYADIIRGPARPREQARLEVHRHHADLQFLLSGEEQLGWRPTVDCHSPAGEYNPVKDASFFADAPVLWHSLAPRSFAIFFPEDAHAGMIGSGEIRKVVVKLLVQ
jgi:biofilm protein TabA